MPTITLNLPLASTHAVEPTSHVERSRVVIAKLTLVLAPAASFTLVKPLSWDGGSPASAGKPR